MMDFQLRCRRAYGRLVLGWLLLGLANLCIAESPRPLGAYGVDLQQTSVSGLSSGAFMATQFDVANSGQLIGVGVVAGGPFYCAGLFPGVAPETAAQTLCMNPLGNNGPKAAEALRVAQRLASAQQIDDWRNLKRQRVYMFSGTQDKVVTQRVVEQNALFFSLAGVPADHIKYVDTVAAGHAMITDSASDKACGVSEGPFINNCGLKQAQDILNWIYPGLKPAAAAAPGLAMFDQSEFDPEHRATLGPVGFVYVPAACEAGGCRVHVVFHGCLQGERKIGDRYARSTGYNEVAEANRLIVLYPQVEASYKNPQGCWDFWGYTSDDAVTPDFYSRQAPQIAAVMRMVKRLGESKK